MNMKHKLAEKLATFGIPHAVLLHLYTELLACQNIADRKPLAKLTDAELAALVGACEINIDRIVHHASRKVPTFPRPYLCWVLAPCYYEVERHEDATWDSDVGVSMMVKLNSWTNDGGFDVLFDSKYYHSPVNDAAGRWRTFSELAIDMARNIWPDSTPWQSYSALEDIHEAMMRAIMVDYITAGNAE